ncbi:uncharacterized protein RAG0_03043 [Rhynchosporium agropyri]|uniref:5'-deoxynucleotidase n=1 Tax=Rhynchosporium agropyri TaxID=914238 RepID=A0A1E1K2Y6_9HELO|nr:uncharacterized protein RAG0_03043 [Rhynchosporium agropyri]
MDTLVLEHKLPNTPFPADDMATAKAIMTILHEVENLKRLPRSGWAIKHIPNPESVAEHSFRLAVMTFFAPADLDRPRLLAMAIVHDLGELFAGDYTPHDKLPKGKTFYLSEDWATSILPNHPAPRYWIELWQEYEERQTAEARWLYDADKMESVIQSREYTGRGYPNLDEFLGLIPKFTTSHMATWGKVLHEEIKHDQVQQRRVPIIFVTGLASIDTTTHSRYLSEEFDGLYLSLSDILLQKSMDAADPEAEFAALYLKKGLETSPVGYMTDLFKDKVDEGAQSGKRCVVIDGFPKTAKQLRSFVEKIQEGLVILLTSADRQPRDSDYTIRTMEELEGQQAERLFKKINCSEEHFKRTLQAAVGSHLV